MPAIVIAAVLAFGLVLAARWGFVAFQNHLDRPRLPSKSIVDRPTDGNALSAHGRQQLYQAVVLMTKLANDPRVILEDKSGVMIKDWLEVCQTTVTDEVLLLDSARRIFHRLEIQEELLKMIDTANPELQKALVVWNQNNSNRKGDG